MGNLPATPVARQVGNRETNYANQTCTSPVSGRSYPRVQRFRQVYTRTIHRKHRKLQNSPQRQWIGEILACYRSALVLEPVSPGSASTAVPSCGISLPLNMVLVRIPWKENVSPGPCVKENPLEAWTQDCNVEQAVCRFSHDKRHCTGS